MNTDFTNGLEGVFSDGVEPVWEFVYKCMRAGGMLGMYLYFSMTVLLDEKRSLTWQ